MTRKLAYSSKIQIICESVKHGGVVLNMALVRYGGELLLSDP
jgi:hypothetical protein